MVYVISQNGKPLMPTEHHGKVRWLLKRKRAKVVRRTPFTIQLLYGTGSERTQPVTLGVDTGYQTSGYSASTEAKVLFEAEEEMRTDIPQLLIERREKRRARRSRKTRYRKPRFNNRTKREGWLPPSVEEKLIAHQNTVRFVSSLLPVSNIVIETAAFDIQKIKNPDIGKEQYQQGEQMGFWNVREYVLYRDGHECRLCGGKRKDPVLEVHHKIRRIDGGSDRPENLITLCSTCHDLLHRGEINADFRKPKGYKAEAMMSIMRWELLRRLRAEYGEKQVSMTFGYITKDTRIRHGLEKSHWTDARCIAGHPEAASSGEWYAMRKLRCHNRKIHKDTILRGGTRKRNQTERIIDGFGLWDVVLYEGVLCYIHGRRRSGYFDIRKLDGTKMHPTIHYRKLTLVERTNTRLIERRKPVPLPPAEAGVSPANI